MSLAWELIFKIKYFTRFFNKYFNKFHLYTNFINFNYPTVSFSIKWQVSFLLFVPRDEFFQTTLRKSPLFTCWIFNVTFIQNNNFWFSRNHMPCIGFLTVKGKPIFMQIKHISCKVPCCIVHKNKSCMDQYLNPEATKTTRAVIRKTQKS